MTLSLQVLQSCRAFHTFSVECNDRADEVAVLPAVVSCIFNLEIRRDLAWEVQPID